MRRRRWDFKRRIANRALVFVPCGDYHARSIGAAPKPEKPVKKPGDAFTHETVREAMDGRDGPLDLPSGPSSYPQARSGRFNGRFPVDSTTFGFPKTTQCRSQRSNSASSFTSTNASPKTTPSSCASCHNPEKGWTDGEKFSTRNRREKGEIATPPTVLNSAYHRTQFWDGRAASLEEQAIGPIHNPIEMGMQNDEVVEKINAIAGYRKQFQAVFGGDATKETIAKAIAAFERTILAGDTPYDRYLAGDRKALSESAIRGMKIFFNKGHCSALPRRAPISPTTAFTTLGLGSRRRIRTWAAARSPRWRGTTAALRLPRCATFPAPLLTCTTAAWRRWKRRLNTTYAAGVANPQLDEEVFPLKLTEQEKKDLVAFLRDGLTSNDYPQVDPPKLPE